MVTHAQVITIFYAGWCFEPLWKMWKSIGMIIPNIWENAPNHQSAGKFSSSWSVPNHDIPTLNPNQTPWKNTIQFDNFPHGTNEPTPLVLQGSMNQLVGYDIFPWISLIASFVDIPSGFIKHGWLENPRTDWRFRGLANSPNFLWSMVSSHVWWHRWVS